MSCWPRARRSSPTRLLASATSRILERPAQIEQLDQLILGHLRLAEQCRNRFVQAIDCLLHLFAVRSLGRSKVADRPAMPFDLQRLPQCQVLRRVIAEL